MSYRNPYNFNRQFQTMDDMMQQFEDWGLSLVICKNDEGLREVNIYTTGGTSLMGMPMLYTWWGRGVAKTRFEALQKAIERIGKTRDDMIAEGLPIT